MTIEQVVNRLRGEPGTRVTLSVLRGSRITFDITLERAVVDVPVVKSALIAPHIGYLQIIEYTPFTPKRVRTALESLLRDGATSLIVDERGNPGGLLNAVVATCDYFLANGTIVSIRSRVASGETVYSATPSTLLPASFPLIVLIDRGSASAAEIFAGAMQDHHRALLVGETSFGKGSVQEVFFLPRGDGAFKLTTARYYTPRGRNIDKVGIEPDVEVKEPEPTQRDQEDLERLIENNTIVNFVRTQPGAGPAKIATFIAQLRAEGITLSTRTLERLIRNEQDRMQTNPPVYDLTYDRPLAEAVRLLRSGQYPGGAR